MKTIHGEFARKAVKQGIDAVANAVKVTLGPKGNNVLIHNVYGSPHSTKDGVTVAKALDYTDPLLDTGASLIKEAASKAVDETGDGTTTVTVLTQALIDNGFKLLEEGVKSIDIKRSWLKELDKIISDLDRQTVLVNKDILKSVANISANNDHVIGDLISDTFDKIGEDGVVKVITSDSNRVEVEITDGSTYDNGYIIPHFINEPNTKRVEYSDVSVLIINDKIIKNEQFIEMLTYAQNNPLLIICDEIDTEALTLAAMNAEQKTIKVCIVTSPGYGDVRRGYLSDIAVSTGASVIESLGNSERPMPTYMGKCKNVVVTRDDFCIIGGDASAALVDKTVSDLKELRSNITIEADIEILNKRIATLIGKVATIKVGANTEFEMRELKDRIDDAVSATSAALEEGVVAGGGLALYSISRERIIGEKDIVKRALYTSLTSPMECIFENAGKDIDQAKIHGATIGYDAQHDEYVDMIEEGIVDPVKVTKTAITTAISIASTVITTECLIYKDYNG